MTLFSQLTENEEVVKPGSSALQAGGQRFESAYLHHFFSMVYGHLEEPPKSPLQSIL